MDGGLEPCQDFYAYACQGYLDSHFMPSVLTGESSVISDMNTLRRNELMRLLYGDTMEDLKPLFLAQPDLQLQFQKALAYFQTCNSTNNYYSLNPQSQYQQQTVWLSK
jgi:hypothetical protein